MRRSLMVIGVMAAGACAHRYASAVDVAPAPNAADTTAEGVVAVVGADPIPTVILQAGDSGVTLVGPLVPELARLAGARVAVTGAVAAGSAPAAGGAPRATIAVRAYTIREIAGGVPVVGVLRANSAHELHVDGVRLTGTPSALAELAGAKVWVVGTRRDDGTLAVSAYGVIVMP